MTPTSILFPPPDQGDRQLNAIEPTFSADLNLDGRKHDEAGEEVLKIALGDSCGLIVMGGYGHSRFRESIPGGTTRHILHHAEIPVLFSH